MTTAVSTDRRTIPPWYKKASYSLVSQNMAKMAEQGHRPQRVEQPPGPDGDRGVGLAAGEGQGQGGPDQQGEGPGIGAVVDRCGVGSGM